MIVAISPVPSVLSFLTPEPSTASSAQRSCPVVQAKALQGAQRLAGGVVLSSLGVYGGLSGANLGFWERVYKVLLGCCEACCRLLSFCVGKAMGSCEFRV